MIRHPMTMNAARALFACAVLAGSALAQKSAPRTTVAAVPPRTEPANKPSQILSGRPDVDSDQIENLLGPVYESKGHGIALRPPTDSVPVRRQGSKDIIEFENEKTGWTLKVTKIMLAEKGTLVAAPDKTGNVQPGVLEFTAKRLKEELPDAEFLREERVNIADGDVGLITLRYTNGLKALLSQQAIIQRTDELYYLLALTTPGAPKGSQEQAAMAIERPAVETFRQVLDSVKLLDNSAVRQEQDIRLFNTRGLFVNFTAERIKKAVIAKQWIRILRNGKDVGYSYIEESTLDRKGGQEALSVRVRSRTMPGNDIQIDTGSVFSSSFDLRHEDWSTITDQALRSKLSEKEYKPVHMAESGYSDRKVSAARGDIYKLQVLYEGNAEHVEPLERGLPPFYLPQAMSHLLVRMLPVNHSNRFMFAIYVPDTRDVVTRYVDVKELQRVVFNGEPMRVVPVEDRIGLEGSVTRHYLGQTGQWVGSENKETGLMMLPSSEAVLLNIWKDAILKAPENKIPERKTDEPGKLGDGDPGAATSEASGADDNAKSKPQKASKATTAKPAPAAKKLGIGKSARQ